MLGRKDGKTETVPGTEMKEWFDLFFFIIFGWGKELSPEKDKMGMDGDGDGVGGGFGESKADAH